MNLRIRSVNTGRVRIIGRLHGEPVLSAIAKAPVAADSVLVDRSGIEGDAQADLAVHGGADKAVYAYSTAHWPWWDNDMRLACRPALFGENLTLDDGDESTVRIGDRFRWGDAVLEIAQPRGPCYKLGIHTAREDVPAAMTLSAKCGWYFRVIAPGRAPVRDAALERVFASQGPSVRDAFRAMFDRKFDAAQRDCIANYPQLAESWKRPLREKPKVRAAGEPRNR